MKSLLRIVTLFFSFAAATAASASINTALPGLASAITGTIELAICGEMDPFELGDACIIYGTDADGKDFGFVTDLSLIDAYDYDALEALTGQQVSLDQASLRPLDDAGVLSVLELLPFADGTDRTFYWWNGTGTLGN